MLLILFVAYLVSQTLCCIVILPDVFAKLADMNVLSCAEFALPRHLQVERLEVFAQFVVGAPRYYHIIQNLFHCLGHAL